MSELISIMWLPGLACLVLVTIHGYLGMHVLSRGIIFVDLALAQFAALGSTMAILFHLDLDDPRTYLLSLSFTLVGAFVFSVTRMREREVPQEAFIGVAWAVASSAGILAVSSAPHGAQHIEDILVGSILWVTPMQVLQAAGIYAVIGLFHWLYRRRFFMVTFDLDRARAERLPVRWWDFLFYASFGFVVTSSVHMAGVLLVFSFLIVPSIVGVLFARSIAGRLLVGWIFGWIVSVGGCLLSYTADLPTGATVVVTFGVGLVLMLVLARIRPSSPRGGAVAQEKDR